MATTFCRHCHEPITAPDDERDTLPGTYERHLIQSHRLSAGEAHRVAWTEDSYARHIAAKSPVGAAPAVRPLNEACAHFIRHMMAYTDFDADWHDVRGLGLPYYLTLIRKNYTEGRDFVVEARDAGTGRSRATGQAQRTRSKPRLTR